MNTILLQEKIDSLLNSVRLLLPDGSDMEYVYSDDLAQLNKSIHDQIDELYHQRGDTVEQEAALCFAMLMGYCVSMYANSEDEYRKQAVLSRSLNLLNVLPPSHLQEQLSAVFHKMHKLCEICIVNEI